IDDDSTVHEPTLAHVRGDRAVDRRGQDLQNLVPEANGPTLRALLPRDAAGSELEIGVEFERLPLVPHDQESGVEVREVTARDGCREVKLLLRQALRPRQKTGSRYKGAPYGISHRTKTPSFDWIALHDSSLVWVDPRRWTTLSHSASDSSIAAGHGPASGLGPITLLDKGDFPREGRGKRGHGVGTTPRGLNRNVGTPVYEASASWAAAAGLAVDLVVRGVHARGARTHHVRIGIGRHLDTRARRRREPAELEQELQDAHGVSQVDAAVVIAVARVQARRGESQRPGHGQET